MSRRSKRGREDGEDEDEEDDVDREVAAAVAAAVAEALPPPILENGSLSIDVDEQASKLKEKRLFDIIDYEQEVILRLEGTEKQMRAPHFKIMSDFVDIYAKDYKLLDYGRMHVRNEMCDIIVVVNTSNMAKFSSEDFDKLKASIAELRDKCTRKDYNANRLDKPNRKLISERRFHSYFTKRVENVLTYLEITKLYAPLRSVMEKIMGEGRVGPIPPELMDEAAQADLFDRVAASSDQRARDFLKVLFVPKENPNDADPSLAANYESKIRNVEELEGITKQEVLDLEYPVVRIEKMIQNWNNILYGPKKARLFQIRYNLSAKLRVHANTPRKAKAFLRRQTTPASKTDQLAEELIDLQKERTALNENHGDDPLGESTSLAEEAREAKRQKTTEVSFELPVESNVEVYHQNTSVEFGLFDESSDEEKEEPQAPRSTNLHHPETELGLPNIPVLAPGGPPTATTVDEANNPFYIGPQPDPGVFDSKGNVLIKRPWTEEETNALIYGMRTFGPGRWVQIKNLYGEIFKNRSSVMLKDKFRNLRRQKKLPDDLLDNMGLGTSPAVAQQAVLEPLTTEVPGDHPHDEEMPGTSEVSAHEV